MALLVLNAGSWAAPAEPYAPYAPAPYAPSPAPYHEGSTILVHMHYSTNCGVLSLGLQNYVISILHD